MVINLPVVICQIAENMPFMQIRERAEKTELVARPVLYQDFGREPAVIYAGDLKDESAILEWLMVMKDPANDPIGDVDEQEIAEAIGQEDAAVAVLTCKQQLTSK